MITTALLAAAADAPPELWSRPWWAEFLTSPGFAGSAAVLGAALAFVSVLVNNGANRRGRERDRWWDMYQATAADLSSYNDRRATMVVAALEAEAKTKFEKQLVAGLIDELLGEGVDSDTEGGEPVA